MIIRTRSNTCSSTVAVQHNMHGISFACTTIHRTRSTCSSSTANSARSADWIVVFCCPVDVGPPCKNSRTSPPCSGACSSPSPTSSFAFYPSLQVRNRRFAVRNPRMAVERPSRSENISFSGVKQCPRVIYCQTLEIQLYTW